MRTKDAKGLYFQGNFKANNYNDAVKELYSLDEIRSRFCVDEDYEAKGYSVVDSRGVQHIYELSPAEFYSAFMNL
jgi:predicted transcriptional regulator